MTNAELELGLWEYRFEEQVRGVFARQADAAHDICHIKRVVANAGRLARKEGADLTVVMPAAWLHDYVIVPKDSPDRAKASLLAADAAIHYLKTVKYDAGKLAAIHHAIHAHSFSANIAPETLEAKVVQDADRLDALGAVGIARTLMLGGVLGKPLYDTAEPIPYRRVPNDRENAIDHFYVKLLRLEERMQTATGKEEAKRRTEFMRQYLKELQSEIEDFGD